MKIRLHPKYIRRLAFTTPILAGLLLSPIAYAQDEEDEEVIELSPFVVETQSDEGYMATQTLAGTRLRTSLEDVGASIQILTEDFLDDIGAVDAEDYLLFTTNTETFGLGGNFTGASGAATGSDSININASRNDSGAGNRVRGIGGADRTRDYYKTAVPNDGYNTERVEINRGANSILFGLGSPSGVVNSGLAQARFRDETELEFRVSDGRPNPSHRTILDINREIIEDKLAIRVIGLFDRRKYDQKPAYQFQDRIYGTFQWRVFDNTTIRGNVETGKTESNRPDPTGPLEAWSHYLTELAAFNKVGTSKEKNDPFVFDPFGYPSRAKGALNQNLFNTPQQVGNRFFQIFEDPQAQNSTWMGKNRTHTNLWPDINPNKNGRQTDHPFWGPNPPKNGIRNQLRFLTINNAGNEERDNYWIGIQDLDIFDFSRTLFFGNSSFQRREFDVANIVLEQSLFNKRAGFELSYYRESWYGNDFSAYTGNQNSIQIDLNKTLWYGDPLNPDAPGGAPNPNFGRPFVRGQTQLQDRNDDRDTIRLTTYGKFDFRDIFESRLGNILGHHTVTGLLNRYERTRIQKTFREFLIPPADVFDVLWDNTDTNIGQRRIDNLVYIGDPIDLISDPNGLTMSDLKLPGEPIMANVYNPGIVRQATFFNTRDQEWQNVPFDSASTFNGGNIRSEVVDSAAFVLQSHFFNGHVIPTYGLRYDEYELQRLQDPDQAGLEEVTADPSLIFNQNILVHPIEPETRSFNLNNKRTITHAKSGTTESIGVVVKVPQIGFKLPFNSEIRLYYNTSENFDPDPGRQDQFGNVLVAPSGETTEYGFNISMFDRRLHARINRYKASLNDATTGPATGAFNQAINAGGFRVMQQLLAERQHDPNETEFVEILDDDGNPVLGEDGEPILEEVLVYPNYHKAMEAIDVLSDFYGIEIDYDNATWRPVGDNPYSKIWEQGEIRVLTNEEGQVTGLDREAIQGIADTQDIDVEGYEFEIVYNPMRNWRIAFNGSKTETVTSNSVPRLQEWIDIFGPVVAGTITDGSLRPSLIGGLRRNNPAEAIRPQDATNFDWWRSNIVVRTDGLVSLDGAPTPENAKWKFTFVTNYTFREGFLKGFNIGGNFRWQDKAAIGYPQITTEVEVENEDGSTGTESIVIGTKIDQPYFNKSRSWVGLNLGYKTTLNWGGKEVDWTIRINANNLFNNRRDLIPISVQPAETLEEMYVAEVRTNAPQTWSITSRFEW
ncbi:MAG: hypothetical protein AB3N63_04055 [Puniceicoccaceae bacterium]